MQSKGTTMKNAEIVDRLKELKASIPDQERNAFLDELFSHYLKATDSTHEQLSTEFEFVVELKSIFDEIK